MLHELRIEEREPSELVLVQIHHEELVRRSEIGLLGSELFIKVAHILAMT